MSANTFSKSAQAQNASPGALAATAAGLAEGVRPPHKAPSKQKWRATLRVEVQFDLVEKGDNE